jgi:ABC-type tungstate transport system permease subunit
MRRIAASGMRFISRGDSCGTHEREQEVWARTGVRPAADRLVVAGGYPLGTSRPESVARS